jgi:YggT family protein
MNALFFLVDFVVTALYWLVLIYVILSFLVGFNVINLNNQIVRQIYTGINSLVDPMLAPIRRILPTAGGLDFSPLVLLLIVMFMQRLLLEDLRLRLMCRPVS